MLIYTRPSSIISGFTIIEVMISMTVMAAGIMAALSTISTLHGVREMTSEQVRLQSVANTICERLLSMPFDDLATANAPWTTLGAAPVTFSALEAAGIIDKHSNVRDTAALWDTKKNGESPGVYIRFYRGIGRPTFNSVTGLPIVDATTGYPVVDTNYPGLMDGGNTTWTLNPNALLVTNGVQLLSTYLADPADPNAATRNPVVIRIRVVSGDGSVELFTARTKG